MDNQHKSNRPIAIVMGRNYTSRLGMIRAAGMAGCDVIVIQTEGKRSKLGTIDDKSKYVVGCKYCPEPDKEGLYNTIKSCSQNNGKPFLLPTDDYTAATIDSYLDLLKKDFFVPNVNNKQGAVLRLMDKSFQKRLALEVGMNVANEWICHWENDCYQIPEGIVFPCFTKPQLSSQGHLKKYQKRCNTKNELREVLSSIGRFFHGPILIEEFHDIEQEYAVVGLSTVNHCVIPAIIQMEYSWQGVTATGKVFPISRIPDLRDNLVKFMQKTQLMGLFDVDLYRSNGKVYFNELNVRFGANGFSVAYTINNLPGLYIDYQLGKDISCYGESNDFEELCFANENCLRQLYFDDKITIKKYRDLRKNAQLHAIEFKEDIQPYNKFKKMDFILPFWKYYKKTKDTR